MYVRILHQLYLLLGKDRRTGIHAIPSYRYLTIVARRYQFTFLPKASTSSKYLE